MSEHKMHNNVQIEPGLEFNTEFPPLTLTSQVIYDGHRWDVMDIDETENDPQVTLIREDKSGQAFTCRISKKDIPPDAIRKTKSN